MLQKRLIPLMLAAACLTGCAEDSAAGRAVLIVGTELITAHTEAETDMIFTELTAAETVIADQDADKTADDTAGDAAMKAFAEYMDTVQRHDGKAALRLTNTLRYIDMIVDDEGKFPNSVEDVLKNTEDHLSQISFSEYQVLSFERRPDLLKKIEEQADMLREMEDMKGKEAYYKKFAGLVGGISDVYAVTYSFNDDIKERYALMLCEDGQWTYDTVMEIYAGLSVTVKARVRSLNYVLQEMEYGFQRMTERLEEEQRDISALFGQDFVFTPEMCSSMAEDPGKDADTAQKALYWLGYYSYLPSDIKEIQFRIIDKEHFICAMEDATGIIRSYPAQDEETVYDSMAEALYAAECAGKS